MSQPVQNLCDMAQFDPLRQGRTIDHQHRQAQRPRRVELGARARAARVLGHNKLRAMILHQGAVIGLGEGPSGHDHICIRQRQVFGFIHQPQKVMVLRFRREVFKMHTSNCQKHALWHSGKRLNRGGDIGHMMPSVTGLRHPCPARQSSKRNLRLIAGRDRVPAHLSGKRMSGIHDVSNAVFADITGQPVNPTIPANTGRQRLRARFLHPSGVRIDRRNPLFGYSFGQSVGLGRTTKNQEVWHV